VHVRLVQCGSTKHAPTIVYSYQDAMATIRRVPSVEHCFQLVITKVYEEGDQELLEDEDESASSLCLW